ncbi:unnamed protein product [Symbiodinium natans]|uniref:Uncharacterized protein n=1 Tax=Symbiodinium natans TaxID=878477 RepID=A0A812RV26_9DINO|nr:unnamed protein product [Symbiodinium natans]
MEDVAGTPFTQLSSPKPKQDQEFFRTVMYDPRVFRNLEWALVWTGLSSSQLVWVFLAAMAAWTLGVTIPVGNALLR